MRQPLFLTWDNPLSRRVGLASVHVGAVLGDKAGAWAGRGRGCGDSHTLPIPVLDHGILDPTKVCAMCDVHWTAYVSALGLPTVAALAALIALQQWKTARSKLKLDLFEKRIAVYACVQETLGHAARNGNLDEERQIAYLSGTKSAKWLFRSDVAAYLDKTLWHKIVDLETQNTLSKDNPNEEDRIANIKARGETMKWLVAQYKEFDKLCKPYLELEH